MANKEDVDITASIETKPKGVLFMEKTKKLLFLATRHVVISQ